MIDNKKNLVLIGIAIFLSMMFIDETGVSVMLPKMQADLGLTSLGIQWVMNGMFLPLAVLVLFAGKLSDHIGYKRIFTVGMITFLLASAVCALAINTNTIILGRIFQGVGASMLLATYAVLISIAFPENEKGMALGTCASIASIFLAIGPFIGGIAIHYLSWRLLFAINIPFGILSLVFIHKALAADIYAKNENQIDLVGAFLFTSGFSLLIYALMEAPEKGWTNSFTILMSLSSLALLVVFFIIQNKRENPLADLSLFRNKNFLAGTVILLSTQIVVMSLTYWAIWLQQSLHYSALKAGFALLPAGLPILVTARWGGMLLDRHGPRRPIAIGCAIVLLGVIWLALTARYENYAMAVIGFIAYGIGAPLVISPSIALVLSSVDSSNQGMASGVLNTMRQLGASLCFAIVGVTIASIYKQSDVMTSLNATYTYAFSMGMYVTAFFAAISLYFAVVYLNHKST